MIHTKKSKPIKKETRDFKIQANISYFLPRVNAENIPITMPVEIGVNASPLVVPESANVTLEEFFPGINYKISLLKFEEELHKRQVFLTIENWHLFFHNQKLSLPKQEGECCFANIPVLDKDSDSYESSGNENYTFFLKKQEKNDKKCCAHIQGKKENFLAIKFCLKVHVEVPLEKCGETHPNFSIAYTHCAYETAKTVFPNDIFYSIDSSQFYWMGKIEPGIRLTLDTANIIKTKNPLLKHSKENVLYVKAYVHEGFFEQKWVYIAFKNIEGQVLLYIDADL